MTIQSTPLKKILVTYAKEHQKDYERFFTVKETPKRGRKVEYNQEAIDACRKNSVGWLVLAGGFC